MADDPDIRELSVSLDYLKLLPERHKEETKTREFPVLMSSLWLCQVKKKKNIVLDNLIILS